MCTGVLIFLLVSVILATVGSVFAHHGWSGYDSSKALELKGTIVESGYEHPHGFVRLKAADKTCFVNAGTLTLTNSSVSGNSSNAFGGGIDTFGEMNLVNSTVSGNSARHGGGIINDGTLTLTSSTVTWEQRRRER